MALLLPLVAERRAPPCIRPLGLVADELGDNHLRLPLCQEPWELIRQSRPAPVPLAAALMTVAHRPLPAR
jgi:hypothetical protein